MSARTVTTRVAIEAIAERLTTAPTVVVTGPGERPFDPSLRYSVCYYDHVSRWLAARVLWTDSRELAEQFAAEHTVYAQPCRVEERRTTVASCGDCDKGLTPAGKPCSCPAGERRRILDRILAPAIRRSAELRAGNRRAG